MRASRQEQRASSSPSHYLWLEVSVPTANDLIKQKQNKTKINKNQSHRGVPSQPFVLTQDIDSQGDTRIDITGSWVLMCECGSGAHILLSENIYIF